MTIYIINEYQFPTNQTTSIRRTASHLSCRRLPSETDMDSTCVNTSPNTNIHSGHHRRRDDHHPHSSGEHPDIPNASNPREPVGSPGNV
jgi:hypothetical protein